MKTLHDLLKEIEAKWIECRNNEEDIEATKTRERLRRLIRSSDMYIGYSSDRTNPNFMRASTEPTSIDDMLKSMKLMNGLGYPDTDQVKNYFTVKYFIEADDQTKENILQDEILTKAIYQCNKMFLRFIEPKWYTKILSKKLTQKNSCDIWDALMCVNDFDKITDEQIAVACFSTNDRYDTSYSIACTLFGEDKVIPIVVKEIEKKAKEKEEIMQFNSKEEDRLYLRILTSLDDETVKKCYPSRLQTCDYMTLCKNDPRYLVHAKAFVDEDANKIWERVSEYSDLIRYCSIIAKCCVNRNIPSYQLNKIKIFAPLVQMYAYDYQQIFEAIKGSFNDDGSIKQDVLALNKVKKAPKPEQTYYCVIKDGNIQIFKSEEERTAANIEGGMKYDFNKVQLRKKMDELLGN